MSAYRILRRFGSATSRPYVANRPRSRDSPYGQHREGGVNRNVSHARYQDHMKINRNLMAATVIALTTAATLAAQPATAASQAAAVCPTGYLCLQPSASSARVVLVKQGDSRSFSGGLQVSQVSNQTGVA